jgi:hypothetical protein
MPDVRRKGCEEEGLLEVGLLDWWVYVDLVEIVRRVLLVDSCGNCYV